MSIAAGGTVHVSNLSDFIDGKLVIGPDAGLGGSGTLDIGTYGRVELGNANGFIGNLVLAGGPENLADSPNRPTLSVGNHLDWQDGNIGGGVDVVLQADASLTVHAGTQWIAGSLELQGVRQWTAGNIGIAAPLPFGQWAGYLINSGTLEMIGERHVEGDGYFLNSGTLRVLPGGGAASLGRFGNQGVVEIGAGTVTMGSGTHSGAFHAAGTSVLNWETPSGVNGFETITFATGATLDLPAESRINIDANTRFDTGSALTIAGDVTLASGSLILRSGSLGLGSLAVNRGFLDVQAGTTLSAMRSGAFTDCHIFGAGRLNGTFQLQGASYIAPGGQSLLVPNHTSATLTFGNDLSLAPGVEVRLDLGGRTPGLGYDVIDVLGSLDLGGATLKVNFTRGFETTAARSDTFVILNANLLSGQFANAPDGSRFTTTDGRGSFLVGYDLRHVTLSEFQAVPEPAHLTTAATAVLTAWSARRRIGQRKVG